ncbi:hypothetical protein OIU77_026119 [Salix suchowensis]|uniref:Uncharacterized protein n=1 Tax=Salix suchowensis TaxID=1278906 RepID=A0ABQ9C0R2_9ROSI|nr:hypothetical protein OIU77_026119 [Salix suchowensis]
MVALGIGKDVILLSNGGEILSFMGVLEVCKLGHLGSFRTESTQAFPSKTLFVLFVGIPIQRRRRKKKKGEEGIPRRKGEGKRRS